MHKKIFSFFVILLLLGTFSIVPMPTYGQLDPNDDLGLNYGAFTGLSADKDVREVIATVIKVSLGFLGTIALVLIVYAGFLWMTAAGKEDQVTTAKNIMYYAVIGLAIILAAFSITTFVVTKLLEATQ